MPVYPELGALDTLDYAERTLWSDATSSDEVPLRGRLIAEAGALTGVADDSYDAVLASHVLEHLADPLGALREWRRVVRPGGYVLLVVPHRDGTFDHLRPVTTIEHMREDHERHSGEDDLTHLQEILSLHDLSRDPGARDRESFEARSRENASIRAMHHHVFVTRTVAELVEQAGLEILQLRVVLPYHIICVCRVGAEDQPPRGEDQPAPLESALRRSPFASDRQPGH